MMQVNAAVKKKRKIKDACLNAITYLSSGLGAFILIAIFVFIFSKGFSSLGFDLLKGNYWSNNYLVSVEESYNQAGNYQTPADLNEGAAFSSKWGIAFVDAQDQNKDNVVLIEYVE